MHVGYILLAIALVVTVGWIRSAVKNSELKEKIRELQMAARLSTPPPTAAQAPEEVDDDEGEDNRLIADRLDALGLQVLDEMVSPRRALIGAFLITQDEDSDACEACGSNFDNMDLEEIVPARAAPGFATKNYIGHFCDDCGHFVKADGADVSVLDEILVDDSNLRDLIALLEVPAVLEAFRSARSEEGFADPQAKQRLLDAMSAATKEKEKLDAQPDTATASA